MAGVYDFDEDDIEPFPSKPSSKKRPHVSQLVKNAEQTTPQRKYLCKKISEKNAAKENDNQNTSQLLQSALKSSKCKSSHQVTTDKELLEVTVAGEGLWCDEGMVQMHSLEFTFMSDSIALKLFDDQNSTTVVWPLDEITGFNFRTCKEMNDSLLEVNLTESGMKLLDQKCHRLLCKSEFVHNKGSSLTTKIKSSYQSDHAREITSLCDCYKRLWKHGQIKRHKRMSLQQDLQELNSVDTHNLVDNGGINGRVIKKGLEDNMNAWVDLTYPKGDPDAVLVTMDDFLLLNPREFVSDTIIDFYIKYLQSRLSDKDKEQCYFFNSFFFRKLAYLDKDPACELEKTSALFEQMKRWTRNINIFTKDFLFIPVIQSCHWSLVIVCHPNHLFDNEHQKCYRGTTILHFDSMEGFHKGVEEKIEKYLVQHWSHMCSTSRTRSDNLNVNFIRAKVPQQTNYSDCGLFMLHYVEMFLSALQSGLSKILVSRQWFNPEDVASKRGMLQRLIKEMQMEEDIDRKSVRKHVDTRTCDAEIREDVSVKEVCSEIDVLQDSPRAGSSCHSQPGDSFSFRAVFSKVAQAAGGNQLCKALDACHSDASVRTFDIEPSNTPLGESNLPSCPGPDKDMRQLIDEFNSQKEESNKMHEGRQFEGFATCTDLARNSEADEMQVSWHTLEASSEEEVDNGSHNLMYLRKHGSRLHCLPFKERQASLRDNHGVSCDLDLKDNGPYNLMCFKNHGSRLHCLPLKEQQASLQDNDKVSCNLDLKDDATCTGLPSRETHLKGNVVSKIDHTECEELGQPATENMHQAPNPQSQQVNISSDDESGFVKIQKIGSASKSRRQGQAGCSKVVRGPISASKGSEGIKNQPSPNAKWRLFRKSKVHIH